MSQILDVPSEQSLAKLSNPILATALALVIDGPEMLEIAADDLRSIKTKISELEDRRKAITAPMDASKKSVMELFSKPTEVLKQAETAIKTAILTYQTEQQRIAAAAQRAADAAAEAERLRMQAAAAIAEDAGDVDTAVAIQSASQMMVANVPIAAPRKVAGISTTVRWSAEVTDKAAYIAHVLTNLDLIDTINIDLTALNRMAVALKGNLNYPGIKAVSTSSISARRA